MIYIYPNGYYTHKLIDMLSEFDIAFKPIDDKDKNNSLESLKDEIGDSLLLICNGEIYNVLENNVKNMGIKNYENAFLYFAKFIAQRLKDIKLEFKKLDNVIYLKDNKTINLFDEFYIAFSMFLDENIIDILRLSFKEAFKNFKEILPRRKLAINLTFSKKDKHLGNIDSKFKDILYIFNSKNDYQINKNLVKNSLIVPSVLSELVANSKFILTLNYPSFRIYKSKVAFLPHCFHPFLVATRFFRGINSYKQYVKNVFFRDLDYIFISSKLEYKILKSTLNSSFQKQKVIKAGYPSLDFNIMSKKTMGGGDKRYHTFCLQFFR